MAVQGRSETTSCPKCFAVVKLGAEFCPECGATLDPASGGSDQEVYNDLAKANLLRNRHQMPEAIEVALGILRKYPNNSTAHTLLGDIYAELDDLKQAAEWYEMALDLSPDSASDQLKLSKVRDRMAAQQSATTARALGIPQSGSHVYIYVAVVIGVVLMCSIIAFSLGRNATTKVGAVGQNSPIIFPGPEMPKPDPGPQTPQMAPEVTVDSNNLTLLRSQSALGARFIEAMEDPRDSSLTVTVRAAGDELPEATAVSAATEVFNRLPTYKDLTIRVVRAHLVEYVATTSYSLFTDALSRNQSPEAVAQAAFSKPWYANSRSSAEPAPQQPAPVSQVPAQPEPSPPQTGGTTEPTKADPGTEPEPQPKGN